MELLFFSALTGMNGILFAKIVELQSQVSQLNGSVETLKSFLTREQRDYGWPKSDQNR